MNTEEHTVKSEPNKLGRRDFLAMTTAAFALPVLGSMGTASAQVSTTISISSSAHPLNRLLKARAKKALLTRYEAASTQSKAPRPELPVNTDESSLPSFIGSFTKTMPHNDLGVGQASAFQALVKAARTGSPADFAAIPRGGAAKLANPQAAFAFSLAGGDSHTFDMPAAPSFSSAWEAGEMVELYAHALLRDVPFEEYSTNPDASDVIDALNDLSDFRGPKQAGLVTAGTLFRGDTAGDLVGNYISQFLLLPVPHGAHELVRTIKTTAQGDDHMTEVADYLAVQRGQTPLTTATFDPTRRFISTARDLGEYVHVDYTYQAFLEAALILLGLKAPVNPGSAYSLIGNQGSFVTFGAADILTLVADAAHEGLKAAWFHKWRVHRRLRPEAFGNHVHQHKTNAASYPIHSDVLNSSVLDEIFSAYGTYLLPMAFPEGSPAHPAYPAGHATIAGACVTVLKAHFNGSTTIAAPVEVDPTSMATALRPYSGMATLTVGGELDKLASNIAIGRDLAGVHWRTDGTEGILLGEKVAIALLNDRRKTYNEPLPPLIFTGFLGNTITLEGNTVVPDPV